MRAVALWAVALVFAVKILVAPGLMPVVDKGGLRITLCTGAGPVEALLDVDGGSGQHDQKSAADACPFAVLGGDTVAADGVIAFAAAPLPFVTPAALPPLPARAPPAAPPPPATGPPSFA